MKTQKTIKGYKFIQEDMKSKNGDCLWELNQWKKHEGNIKLCNEGLHACRTARQSLQYVYGDKWFIVEARGKIKEEKGDKFVASEMRLIKKLPAKKIINLWAIRCAKRCLKNFEKSNPNDKRPAEAIKAAEDYLDNKITIKELEDKISAAESAAWSAESAAWSAARSAESAAWSAAESAAESAAWSAAWSAARSAESAAWSAAWSAESAAWSAAWSAARSAESAAWSAAWSAESAAWSAARSAARSAESAAWSAAWSAESAAWSAARSAEEKWQEKELNKIIKEVLKNEA